MEQPIGKEIGLFYVERYFKVLSKNKFPIQQNNTRKGEMNLTSFYLLLCFAFILVIACSQ